MDFRQSSEKYSTNRRKSDVKGLQLSKNRTFLLKFRKIFGGIENGFF